MVSRGPASRVDPAEKNFPAESWSLISLIAPGRMQALDLCDSRAVTIDVVIDFARVDCLVRCFVEKPELGRFSVAVAPVMIAIRAVKTQRYIVRLAEDQRRTATDGVEEPHPAIVLPAAQPYQKRTKSRRIYRYFPLLALSNLSRTNGRWVDCDRVKMALYR